MLRKTTALPVIKPPCDELQIAVDIKLGTHQFFRHAIGAARGTAREL